MICYLKYGAATTLELTSSDFSMEEIQPGAFATTSQEVSQTVIRVAIEGRPNIYAASEKIGDFITQTQVNNGRAIGASVYLYYQPANQSVVYRALVKALAFNPDPSFGQFWKVQRHCKGEFIVVHQIWEGELTQIPLSNTYASDDLTGLQIDNALDATHDNTAAIDSLDVTGDAPTPAMIVLENTYNAAFYVDEVIIGLNINSTPGSFTYCLEAEDLNPSGGDVVSATSSAGKYTRITGAASVQYWTLSANQVTYANGNQFHVVLRLGPNAGADAEDCYYYLSLSNDGSALPIWLSDPIYIVVGSYFQNIGTIRIPPWKLDYLQLADQMRLYLYIYSKSGAAVDVDIDAVYLIPVDGYRQVELFGGLSVAFGERLVDDMIEDELYLDTGAGTSQSRTIVAMGSRILLRPGMDQKLYFLSGDYAGGYPGIIRTWDLKVYYRPRRLAL